MPKFPDTIPPEIRRAYGRYGAARSGEKAWRATQPNLESRPDPTARHPIRARRAGRLQSLNGWIQILLVALTAAILLCAGFVAGAVYEIWHPTIVRVECKRG